MMGNPLSKQLGGCVAGVGGARGQELAKKPLPYPPSESLVSAIKQKGFKLFQFQTGAIEKRGRLSLDGPSNFLPNKPILAFLLFGEKARERHTSDTFV